LKLGRFLRRPFDRATLRQYLNNPHRTAAAATATATAAKMLSYFALHAPLGLLGECFMTECAWV